MSVRGDLEMRAEFDALNNCFGFRWITEQVNDLRPLAPDALSKLAHQPLRPS
jgi:hypothetical protein